MSCEFCLFELGSVSLKFHYRPRDCERTRKIKIPWRIGHEVFQTGVISRPSIDGLGRTIRSILDQFRPPCDPGQILAFATGVFRAAQNSLEVRRRVEEEAGLKIRVISGDQEAALLKALFLEVARTRPAFAFDLGGGSLQWVHLREGRRSERASLSLGTIRVLKMLGESSFARYPDLARKTIDRFLSEIPRVHATRLCGTGGAVKAVSAVVGRRVCDLGQLDSVDAEVRRNGPPEELRPHRRRIFLPGLTVIRRLLVATGATELEYVDLSVGQALLKKVLPYYEKACDEAPRPSTIVKKLRYSTAVSGR